MCIGYWQLPPMVINALRGVCLGGQCNQVISNQLFDFDVNIGKENFLYIYITFFS